MDWTNILNNKKTAELNAETYLELDGEAPVIKFPALTDLNFVKHGFSSKLGGVSEGCYASMNLGIRNGDSEDKVLENFRRICNSIGIKRDDLVFSDQVHKTNVRRVTRADLGKGMTKPRDYQDIDAHITNEPDVPLLIFGADCVPIYFVDTKTRAIGLAHSGWKGTAGKIGLITVQRMGEEFGTRPENLVALIGPSICCECYEVDEVVAKAFRHSFSEKELNSILLPGKRTLPNEKRYQLDLWKANEMILSEAGIPKTQITVCGLCTMCHPTLLFSHRRDGNIRGSMAGFLSL